MRTMHVGNRMVCVNVDGVFTCSELRYAFVKRKSNAEEVKTVHRPWVDVLVWMSYPGGEEKVL